MRNFGAKLIFVLFFITVLAVSGFFLSIKIPYKATVIKCSESYAVDAPLIYAVMCAESGFNERAVSGAGAIGLMQIMPATAEWLSGGTIAGEELFKPEKNIDTGVRYLAYLSREFTETWQVLAAYNAGETKAREWVRAGLTKKTVPYSETRNYISRVEELIKLYKFRLIWIK